MRAGKFCLGSQRCVDAPKNEREPGVMLQSRGATGLRSREGGLVPPPLDPLEDLMMSVVGVGRRLGRAQNKQRKDCGDGRLPAPRALFAAVVRPPAHLALRIPRRSPRRPLKAPFINNLISILVLCSWSTCSCNWKQPRPEGSPPLGLYIRKGLCS